MAQLSGSQVERLQAALLDAFDRSELTQMVQVELEENLEQIAGSGSLSDVVFNLIRWAERHGRVGDLIGGAQSQRPGNRGFLALAGELGGAAHESMPKTAVGKPASAPGGITIGKIEAVNVGETQFINQQGATFNVGDRTEIDTGGGAYIGGSVSTGGGDFVGRDKIVHGDQVGGDKIEVGDVSGTGIAIGRGAQARVQQGLSGADLDKLFAPLMAAVNAAPSQTRAEAQQKVEELKSEVAKGDKADDSRMAKLIDGLVGLVPGAVSAVTGIFVTPVLSGLAGNATKFVLDKIQGK